jgi:hypothetical protein
VSRARDDRKKNARLNWAVRNNPAVAALYPELAEALRAADRAAERAA